MTYPWQVSQWEQLSEVFKLGRLPHALMFSGMAGTGKKQFSAQFASLVLCDQIFNQAHTGGVLTPCGECKNCKLVLAEAHPDIRHYTFELNPKGVKSSVITIDQIRSLNEFVAKSSQQGGYKVAIIYPAEAMNVNAANALLKSLEEPSQKTLIVLVVDQPGRMLPTIRSRCQVIEFPMPDYKQSMDWLNQALPDNALLEDLLELANGSPIKAEALAETDAISQKQTMITELAQVLKREASVVSIASKWQKHDIHTVLGWNLSWVQQLIRFSMTHDDALVRDDRLLKMFQYLSGKHGTSLFYGLLDKIQTYSDLLAKKTNPNPQILIENLLIAWAELMQKTKL